MKKKTGFIWSVLGFIPYVLLLVYSIYASIHGIDTCLFHTGGHCLVLHGLKGFAQAWYIGLSTLFPIFLVFLLFIILGFSKTRFNAIARSRMLLVFGVSPFVLALFTLLFASIASPSTSFSALFSDIFMRQFFVVISELIGIVFVLLGLHNLKKAEKKEK